MMSQKHACLVLWLVVGMTVSARAADGERWFARWESDSLFYEVTVEKTEGDKSFVRYTMDGTTEWVPQHRLGKFTVSTGDAVEVKWWKDKKYYRATVTHRAADSITVRWQEGGAEEDTPISMIRLKLVHPAGRQVGERVLGRWEADGYWYPGKIDEFRDGKYHVVYDAGGESWLAAEQVLPHLPTFYDPVEAKWSRDGKYYKAQIARRDGDKVRVDWQDGTSEETTMDKLRVDADQLVIRYTK